VRDSTLLTMQACDVEGVPFGVCGLKLAGLERTNTQPRGHVRKKGTHMNRLVTLVFVPDDSNSLASLY